MKNNIFWLFFLPAGISCSTLSERAPSSEVSFQSVAFPSSSWAELPMTAQQCQDSLQKVRSDLSFMKGQAQSLNPSVDEWKDFEKGNFEFRKSLSAATRNLPPSCIHQMRQVFVELRTVQDLLAEKIFGKSLPFSNQIPDLESFPFQTGDVLLVRGSSFLSSTIAQVSSNKSPFIHVVFVYVDPRTGEAFSMESNPNKGARIYPIKDALVDNVRILLLRPRDPEKARQAVAFIHEKISKALKKQKPIDYDYFYDEKDHTRLSCVEVLQEGYEFGAQENVPLLKSKVHYQNEKFLKSVGMKNGDFFVPGDLETDYRFEPVFEWVNYGLTHEQRMKDAVVSRMIQWIDRENYKMHGDLKSHLTAALLELRGAPGVWNLLSRPLGLAEIPLEVPTEILVTMVKLNKTGRLLLERLQKEDQLSLRQRKRHLSGDEMVRVLEQFREEDRENYLQGSGPFPLHLQFSPPGMRPASDRF